MTKYEKFLDISQKMGMDVREKPLRANKGRIMGNRIAIRKDLTETEKTCVLAEEIGHARFTTGDILKADEDCRRQELQARAFAYTELVGISGIIRAFTHGCRNCYEISEFLGITEEFLDDAIDFLHQKYGCSVSYQQYVIFFDPYFTVMKLYNKTPFP